MSKIVCEKCGRKVTFEQLGSQFPTLCKHCNKHFLRAQKRWINARVFPIWIEKSEEYDVKGFIHTRCCMAHAEMCISEQTKTLVLRCEECGQFVLDTKIDLDKDMELGMMEQKMEGNSCRE